MTDRLITFIAWNGAEALSVAHRVLEKRGRDVRIATILKNLADEDPTPALAAKLAFVLRSIRPRST